MSSELTYALEQTKMEHYTHEGINYRKITGHSWGQLEELERVYKRRGHRTYLNFGNICDDTYQLTIQMGKVDELEEEAV